MSVQDASPARRSDEGEDEFVELGAIVNIVRRRFWAMLLAGALTLAAVVIVTFQQTPEYTASSELLLEVREQQVLDFESVVSGLPPDSAVVDTEVQVLSSRALAETVADELNLAAIPEFNPALREPGLIQRTLSGLRGLFGAFRQSRADQPDAADSDELERERVIDALMRRVEANRVGLTYVIELSATSQSPRLAQEIANTYADEYLDAQLEAKFAATERANDFLNERVAALRDEVRNAEQAVARYRAQEGLLNAEGATLTEQQISDINAQLAAQRAELSEARARLRNVQSRLAQGVSPESIGEVLRSDVIRELRAQQAQVSHRRGELATRYGPRHPEILTVERELVDIQDQIDQEVERIVANLQNEVDVSRERVASLETSLSNLRTDLAADDASLVRLRELEREAEASRALFESFLNRFRQTNASEQLTDADARIVARAAVPTEPSAPNLMLNFALGVVLGGLAAAAAAAALEMLDTGLRTEPDVERKLATPHIASAPRLKTGLLKRMGGARADPTRYVVDKPLSSFAESFRTLRSSISVAAIDTPMTVIAVTSALPGEGKTTASLCLGRVSSQASDRVIVVDCDLRRRQLSRSIAPDAQAGLLDILSERAALDDVLIDDPLTDMKIIPLTERSFSPRDVFRSQAFADLIAQLRDRFDLVILDTAPVMAVADTRTVAAVADGVVYAAEWGRTTVSSARMALQALQSARANVLGVLLNSVDVDRQGRYGYGAYYGYYREYRKYYSG